jgi:hypothetical protein
MIDLNALRIEGFVEIEGLESEEHLVELARGVGKCLPNPDGYLISKVRANNGNCARQGTFSHAYGLSSFPMHTVLDDLWAFLRHFEGSQVKPNALHFEGQLVAGVFQFLDSVHLHCLWGLRLIGMVVEWLARPVMSRRYLDQQARRQAALASPSSVPGTVFTT